MSSPKEAEVEEIKLIIVIRSPIVDSRTKQKDVQSNIKILLLLVSRIRSIYHEKEMKKRGKMTQEILEKPGRKQKKKTRLYLNITDRTAKLHGFKGEFVKNFYKECPPYKS